MTDDQGYSHERELGRRIAQLREGAGLTQREVARRMDLTQSALSRIESGQRRLSAAQVSQLARILAIDPGLLLQAEPTGAGEPFAAKATESSRHDWKETAGPRGNARAIRAEGVQGLDANLGAGPDAGRAGAERLASMGSPSMGSPSMGPPSTLARVWGGDASGAASFTEELAAPAAPQRDVPRGRARPRALEPTVFAEVVRDALEVEALVVEALAGAGGEPHLADFSRPSPFAALPYAAYAEPTRLARFWRHELGVGDEGPLPDLVPLLEAAGVDVVHARLDGDTPHGACALVAAPWASANAAASAAAGVAAAATAPVRPFVFINGFGRPVALQRFALAHQFAHLALGHGEAYDERIDWSGRSRRETDANAFAEEFVAPLAAVRRWFEMDGEAAGPAASRGLTATPSGGGQSDAGSGVAQHRDSTAAALDAVIRLANHFGVSFWVARYRARAAGVLSSPTQLRSVDQMLRARDAQWIPRQLFLGGLRDTLSVLTAESRPGRSRNPWRIAPNGVRVPGRMRAQVLALLEAGVVPLEQAAAWLRFEPAELRAQLEQLGVE